MKRALVLAAVALPQAIAPVASAALSAGPELDVGTLGEGSQTSLPTAQLALDGAGIVAAFRDGRVPNAMGSQLFVQRLGPGGVPLGAATLVATDVASFVLVGAPAEALLLWTSALGVSTNQVQSTLVRADGSIESSVPITELQGLPASMACASDGCIAVTAAGFQHVDLRQHVAAQPFQIAPTDAVSPSPPLVATRGDAYVAICSGLQANTPSLLSAELGLDASVARPFETQAVAGVAPPRLGLAPGGDGYLAGLTVVDSSYLIASLRVVTLDGVGRATGNVIDLPADRGTGNWAGTFANGSYRVVLGGSPQHFASVTPGTEPSVGELAVNADQSVRFAAVVPDASGVLTSFDQPSLLPGDDPQPNLAELGLDGSVQSTGVIGTRPSQQAWPLLAAANGEFLLTYSALGRDGSAVAYSFLGPDGTPLVMDGEIALGASSSSVFDNGALSAADGRFLLSQNSGFSLFDSTGAVTQLVLQQDPDLAPSAVIGTLGVGQVLILLEYSGGCGEDCRWSDVGARRYGLNGAALDAGLLFGADPKARNQVGRGGPIGIWDGDAFVVVAQSNELEWRRVGADGTLLDADWRPVDPGGNGDYASAYGVATANGVTFVAWSHEELVYASRIAPDGTIDPAPLQIAQLSASPPPDPGSGVTPVSVVNPDGLSVAYDGSRFVVAWSVDGIVRAVAVEPDGTVHPSVTLTRAATAPQAHGASLASLGDGKLLVGYHRFDADPASLTSRVKLRVVAEGPAELGSDCTSDDDCASTFCTNGFCCDARCDQPGSSCASANTDAADGTCSLVTAADPPDAGTPSVSCDDDGVCPPRFTCDAVKLVCVPPRVVAAAPVTNGCGCRVEQGGNSTAAWFGLAVALSMSVWRRRAPSPARRDS